jgi:hypothetical protein
MYWFTYLVYLCALIWGFVGLLCVRNNLERIVKDNKDEFKGYIQGLVSGLVATFVFLVCQKVIEILSKTPPVSTESWTQFGVTFIDGAIIALTNGVIGVLIAGATIYWFFKKFIVKK